MDKKNLCYSLKTPVLFLVFNRPNETGQVFRKIRKAKPPKLYVAVDGPRLAVEGENETIEKVREIATNVDWSCEVKTLFRDKNLGCKYAVSEAIDWFFENEEQGIILEDDCLPSHSFFKFCEDLLDKYKNNSQVGMISGCNLTNYTKTDQSYFFSYGGIWGWATWKRAWKDYDVEMKKWKNMNSRKIIKSFINNDKIYEMFKKNYDKVFNGDIDTWDYQWQFTRLLNKSLTATPCKNLVSNIGFNEKATHTSNENKYSNLKSHNIEFPLIHPKKIYICSNFEKRTIFMHYKEKKNIFNKLKILINKLKLLLKIKKLEKEK